MTPYKPSQVAVVGLGYVGLHVATAFGRIVPTTGFDISADRIRELEAGLDRHGEVGAEALEAPQLSFTSDAARLVGADFVVVAVPTPIDAANRPDLSYLIAASRDVGAALRLRKTRAPLVVFESTVYPGCVEEVCIPAIEDASGLANGADFKVGYSPERINPGDPEHAFADIVKVVAAQDEEATERVAQAYGLVVRAGVYKAPNIRTAEAAKVIENVQRDVNVALMNELAMLFDKLGLKTHEVLETARTKWNFLPFEPGLVGGHCIPVDPYYLTHKAQEVGHHPEVILAGRRINDGVGRHVAQETVRLLIDAGKVVRGARVLVLGIAFKENVRDTRNSQVIDLVRELERAGVRAGVHDPLVGTEAVEALGLAAVADPWSGENAGAYDAVVLAVPHRELLSQPLSSYVTALRDGDAGILVDVRGALRKKVASKPFAYWSL